MLPTCKCKQDIAIRDTSLHDVKYTVSMLLTSKPLNITDVINYRNEIFTGRSLLDKG